MPLRRRQFAAQTQMVARTTLASLICSEIFGNGCDSEDFDDLLDRTVRSAPIVAGYVSSRKSGDEATSMISAKLIPLCLYLTSSVEITASIQISVFG
jgi:hypothetical protein